ncbi:uncharacterized protein LOC131939295 [Physella acuta]|uniref:uncharacterized protein LOC131939295 n=1 Tax=Physella acuta TaxID=109671 RepID=UPI0027DB25A2|nr:uncharacterized protein LOC131939295 [Physella acuta]XP_059153497.1 uncharacterized protein LOC131939295 [Physella acuta]
MFGNNDDAKKSLFKNVSLLPQQIGDHLTQITVYALFGENPLASLQNRITSFRGGGERFLDQLNARNIFRWATVCVLANSNFYWDTTGGTGQIKCFRCHAVLDSNIQVPENTERSWYEHCHSPQCQRSADQPNQTYESIWNLNQPSPRLEAVQESTPLNPTGGDVRLAATFPDQLSALNIIQRVPSIPTVNVCQFNANKRRQQRILSYGNVSWARGDFSPENLASMGYIYTGNLDQVKCDFCGFRSPADWTAGSSGQISSLLRRHEEFKPDCPCVINSRRLLP